ncbi:UNVERIFIED_CONTAM: hypothetical protein FKN15_000986 [Acipenser sinensis]
MCSFAQFCTKNLEKKNIHPYIGPGITFDMKPPTHALDRCLGKQYSKFSIANLDSSSNPVTKTLAQRRVQHYQSGQFQQPSY